MMVYEKSIATEAVMIFLAVILTLVTIIGNGAFLAIFGRFKVNYSLGVEYFNWKKTKKAKIAVFLIWFLVSLIVVLLAVIPVFYMDLDDVPILQSQRKIFQGTTLFITPIIALCTLSSTVLGIWTIYLIHKKLKERVQLNLPPLAAEARLKLDIKANTTIAVAVLTYYICYIPTVVLSMWLKRNEQQILNSWFPFMAALSAFLSGALNPVIYVTRNRRYRSAIWQFLKDPCGTSAFRDPLRKENESKQPEMKPPQIQREEVKDYRDPTAFPNPGGNTRRPEDDPDLGPGSDTRPAEAGPVPGNDTRRQQAVAGPGSNTRRPIVGPVPGNDTRRQQAVAGPGSNTRLPIAGPVPGDDTLRPKAVVGPGSNTRRPIAVPVPGDDTRQPKAGVGTGSVTQRAISAKIHIHKTHSVVKMAWEEREVNGIMPASEKIAVAEESRRGGEEGTFSGLVKGKGKKMKTAERKEIGHVGGVRVKPQLRPRT